MTSSYEKFQALLNSKDPSNVDDVNEYIAEFITENSDRLLGYARNIYGSQDAEDAMQIMAIATITDLSLQTSGEEHRKINPESKHPKWNYFAYIGSSEEEFFGHLRFRLKKRSKAYSDIFYQRKKHNLADTDYQEVADVLPCDEDTTAEIIESDLENIFSEVFNSIKKPEHQLGIAMREGFFGLSSKSTAADIKKVAKQLKVKQRSITQILNRYETMEDLVSVKFDAKHVGKLLGISTSHFRKIIKSYLDEVKSAHIEASSIPPSLSVHRYIEREPQKNIHSRRF